MKQFKSFHWYQYDYETEFIDVGVVCEYRKTISAYIQRKMCMYIFRRKKGLDI